MNDDEMILIKLQRDAIRYRFLRNKFALNADSDEKAFAALAKLSGTEFDAAVDKAMDEEAKNFDVSWPEAVYYEELDRGYSKDRI